MNLGNKYLHLKKNRRRKHIYTTYKYTYTTLVIKRKFLLHRMVPPLPPALLSMKRRGNMRTAPLSQKILLDYTLQFLFKAADIYWLLLLLASKSEFHKGNFLKRFFISLRKN